MQGSQLATAFGPVDSTNGTVAIAAGTTSQDETLPGERQGNTLQIFNNTSAVAFCTWGVGAQTAIAGASYPVAPGAVVVVNCLPQIDTVAVILSSGSGNVYFTKGWGL